MDTAHWKGMRPFKSAFYVARHSASCWWRMGFISRLCKKSVDKLKYEAIGESDRMTLKFGKH